MEGKNIPKLNQAVAYAQKNTAILEIINYHKWGLRSYKPRGHITLPPLSSVRSVMKNVGFPKAEYEHIQNMLANHLNISKGEKFGVIQWRPQVLEVDWFKCAEAVMWSRDHISERDGIPEENFILISPLSLGKELQWGGVAHQADRNANTSYPALQMLFDAGFHKLEQAFEGDIADGGLLAIWDFILAQTATTFASCQQNCPKNYRDKGNYKGASVKYVMSSRERYPGHGKTDKCWPH